MIVLVIMLSVIMTLVLAGVPSYMLSKVSTPPALDYDKRWGDPGYVSMIHATRERERALGFDLSTCECETHKSIPPKPAAVQRPTEPFHIDSESPAYRTFKVTAEYYDDAVQGNRWRKPDTFMGLPVVSVRGDWSQNVVYIKCSLAPKRLPKRREPWGLEMDNYIIGEFGDKRPVSHPNEYRKYVANLPAKYWK